MCVQYFPSVFQVINERREILEKSEHTEKIEENGKAKKEI